VTCLLASDAIRQQQSVMPLIERVAPKPQKKTATQLWLRKKTLRKRREVSQKPLLPVLREIINTSRCGALTFLQT
jgi:hypothetical protein